MLLELAELAVDITKICGLLFVSWYDILCIHVLHGEGMEVKSKNEYKKYQ